MAAALHISVGRIETLALDAVVNAANCDLSPGAGVDGALRAAAGPELTHATSALGPIKTGEAILTPGFKLPARYIIHTAAPIWATPGDVAAKHEGLTRCYTNSIVLAHMYGLQAIAFPSLGTGIYGWPRDMACDIAVSVCEIAPIPRIVFCCFSEADADVYRRRIG